MKLMSRLDSMHAFISRTIIVIEIPLSMRQSYAVVCYVIVIVIGIGIVIIVIMLSLLLSFVKTNILQVVDVSCTVAVRCQNYRTRQNRWLDQ